MKAEGDQLGDETNKDFELDKIKIKKSTEINEKKRLANRARNSKYIDHSICIFYHFIHYDHLNCYVCIIDKVNTSQMGGIKNQQNSRNNSQNPNGSQNASVNKE